jgi:hypothetical protein
MSKRLLVWHVGAAQPARPVIAANLTAHHESLEAEGVQVAATAEEARLVTHELLRTHRAAGLSRSQVEGHWSRLCDRVWKHKGVSLLSTPDLGVADKDQIKLALDPLIGVEVHLVFTVDSFSQQIYGGWLAELRAGRTTDWDKYAARVLSPSPDHQQAERFWAGHDLDALLSRWGWTFRAERLHVVASPDVREHWRQFLEIARLPFDARSALVPAYADPAGVAVLRKVNRQLEEPLADGSVELLTGFDREGSAMPAVPTTTLRPLVERWADSLAGHDLRGDLALLLDGDAEQRLPGPRDQLAAAVDVLAEVLAENSRLRALAASLEKDRDRLDRKRRKWKRRAKQAPGSGRPRPLSA